MQSQLDYVTSRLTRSADLKHLLSKDHAEPISAAARLIATAFKSGNKLLVCGNGGSAADSQHMAAEFVGRLQSIKPREAWPALALTTDTSFITAWANDVGYADVFSRQVGAFGKKGDVLLAISTSGNSENVLWAVRKAQRIRMHVVALTGSNGKISKDVAVAIKVPSKETQLIQEAHLCIEHIICELVEKELLAD